MLRIYIESNKKKFPTISGAVLRNTLQTPNLSSKRIKKHRKLFTTKTNKKGPHIVEGLQFVWH